MAEDSSCPRPTKMIGEIATALLRSVMNETTRKIVNTPIINENGFFRMLDCK